MYLFIYYEHFIFWNIYDKLRNTQNAGQHEWMNFIDHRKEKFM